MPAAPAPTLGALYLGNRRCRFRVWAPRAEAADLHIIPTPDGADRLLALRAEPGGYFSLEMDDVPPGAHYFYRLHRGGAATLERPDPASRYQPAGIWGPSEVVDSAFPWTDQTWRGIPLSQTILYELHVGTFSPEGTFGGILGQLDRLAELGITAIELMPVAQFPGERNWGYDGVFPYAAQNSYGGPAGLKKLVNACHRRGLAVVLDVVYNHLGPEGNILPDFAPYFTDQYCTPWGAALNFDGAHSDDVRRYFLENALHWVTDYHIDGLRLDAVHAIHDQSPITFLHELATAVRQQGECLNRRIHTMAESDNGDPKFVRSQARHGDGMDAQWNDDFHHALHAVITGEKTGYYADFGTLTQLAKAYRCGYVYTGEYSVYRQRRHGAPAHDIPAAKLIVYAQNHDQTGNRRLGERLNQLVSWERQKLAAGAVLLSPYVPLLFMGEEYGETAPFQYFVSHENPHLVEAVRRGRPAEAPDPQSEETFRRSKLNPDLRHQAPHDVLLDYYAALIHLRRSAPALLHPSKKNLRVECFEPWRLLLLFRRSGENHCVVWLHFGAETQTVRLPLPEGKWHRAFDSSETRWAGAGSALPSSVSGGKPVTLMCPGNSVAVFQKD